MHVRHLCLSIFCILLSSAASCGGSGPTPNQLDNEADVRPRVLYEEGVRKEQEGKYEEAYELYKRSYSINGNISALANLAKLLDEKLGRPASAWVEYDRLLKAATSEQESEAYKKAQERAEAIWESSPKLTVVISDQLQKLDGLVVMHNGRPFDKDLWNREFPVDRGEHRIEVNAKSKKSTGESLQITDKNQRIEISKLEDLDPPYLAYTLGGAGVAFLIVGGVFAGLSSSQWDDALQACNALDHTQETACKDNAHKNTATPDGESAHTKAIISTVALATGTAAVLTGAALWFFYSPPAAPAHVGELKISPFVFGASDWGMGVSGKF